MSRSNYDETVADWLDSLTGPQSQALAHQVGVSGAITFPVEKLRKLLVERKTFKKVKKVYEENYVNAKLRSLGRKAWLSSSGMLSKTRWKTGNGNFLIRAYDAK